MKKRAWNNGEIASPLAFVLLALGLVGAIYVLRVVPAQEHLDAKRAKRQAWEESHREVEAELRHLDVLAATLGRDHQATERVMRQLNFARPGEVTIEVPDQKH